MNPLTLSEEVHNVAVSQNWTIYPSTVQALNVHATIWMAKASRAAANPMTPGGIEWFFVYVEFGQVSTILPDMVSPMMHYFIDHRHDGEE